MHGVVTVKPSVPMGTQFAQNRTHRLKAVGDPLQADLSLAIPVGAFPNKEARIVIAATATVQWQGTNDDPNDGATVWTQIGTDVTSTGAVTSTEEWKWVRFEVTATTGAVDVDFIARAE